MMGLEGKGVSREQLGQILTLREDKSGLGLSLSPSVLLSLSLPPHVGKSRNSPHCGVYLLVFAFSLLLVTG